MKARVYRLAFAAIAVATMVNFSASAQSVVKNYSKTYPVDANDKLVINTSYGKVTVNTWARNEIKVDVQMKVEGRNAQKQLDDINISDSKDASTVVFKTNFSRSRGGWSSWFGGNNGFHNMEIDYTVYMPAKNNAEITDHYGPIILPDMEGNVTINSSYGSLTAKSLNNNNNYINVNYGQANIDNLRTGDLNIKYGNLTIGGADKINLNLSYSGSKIGRLNSSANINARYGDGVQIKEVGQNLRNLSVNATYSNVRIGVNNDLNTDFNVTVKFGSFSYNTGHMSGVIQTGAGKRGWSPTQNYIGHLGKGGADKLISVSTTYGTVKFD